MKFAFTIGVELVATLICSCAGVQKLNALLLTAAVAAISVALAEIGDSALTFVVKVPSVKYGHPSYVAEDDATIGDDVAIGVGDDVEVAVGVVVDEGLGVDVLFTLG